MKNEINFILLSSLRNRTEEEDESLSEIFNEPLDWGFIAGQLMCHRLGGYVYFGLTLEQRNQILPEFRKNLELLIKAQKMQVRNIAKEVLPVIKELNLNGIRYAGLKGLIFNTTIYQIGERRSNDTDFLVLEEDLIKLDEILRRNGYIQTFLPNGEHLEASKKDKLIQRMNYHDLVPYVKKVESDLIEYNSLDINFHFDSKDNDITRKVLEKGTVNYENELYQVKGLPWELNLAHLCVHFYREASNSLWIPGREDLTLYKLIDIANEIRMNDFASHAKEWCLTIKELQLQQAAFYTLYHLSLFYPKLVPDLTLKYLEPMDTSFLNKVSISGEDRTIERQHSFYDLVFNLVYKKIENKEKIG